MIGGGGKFKRSRAISVLTSSLENTVAHSGGGTVAQFQQRQILGKWRQGYALDLHTLSSVPIGYNEYGHMQFDTTRSEVGELLYRLKNRSDTSTVDEIVAAAVTFLNTWHPPIEMIIPVPASSARDVQPVMLLAKGISDQLNIPLVECVTKTRETPQLKNIFDLDERLKALDGVHAVDAAATQGRKILLFDDLYRSGATMNAITSVLYEQGKAADVFALTITRTRSFR
jgi:predicted amidophosphoribosyltransferase